MGVEVNWVFKWAWNPGILPFILVALLIIPLHKMKGEQIKAAWKETGSMVGGAAIALLFGIAMVQLFRNSGAAYNNSGMESMLIVMANGLAALFGKAYIIVAPIIGVIGAFISGSATVSLSLIHILNLIDLFEICNDRRCKNPAVLIEGTQNSHMIFHNDRIQRPHQRIVIKVKSNMTVSVDKVIKML